MMGLMMTTMTISSRMERSFLTDMKLTPSLAKAPLVRLVNHYAVHQFSVTEINVKDLNYESEIFFFQLDFSVLSESRISSHLQC